LNDLTGQLGLPIIGIDELGISQSYANNLSSSYLQAVNTSDAGKHITKRLSLDSRVSELSVSKVRVGPRNYAQFDRYLLAAWWMMRANEEGILQADKDLEIYLDSDNIDVLFSYWVVGFNIKQNFEIGDGYTICSIDNMINSDSKERYKQGSNKTNRMGSSIPRAAICKLAQMPKIYEDQNNQGSEIANSVFERISLIIKLLNCMPELFCLPWEQSGHLPPNVPNGLIGTSDLRWPYSDSSFQKIVEIRDFDVSMIKQLIIGFTKLDTENGKRISMALDRFAIAKASRDAESAVLDLGIALEMVLLSGEGTTTQITQTLSLRGSWLIGQDGRDREDVFKKLKSVYGYRSDVAHKGFSKKLQKNIHGSGDEYLKSYFTLAERIFCKIIIGGTPRLWDKIILDA
jgi:hypothetical protein